VTTSAEVRAAAVALAAAGWSYRRVGRLLGVSREAVRGWANGELAAAREVATRPPPAGAVATGRGLDPGGLDGALPRPPVAVEDLAAEQAAAELAAAVARHPAGGHRPAPPPPPVRGALLPAARPLLDWREPSPAERRDAHRPPGWGRGRLGGA
jgi:Homeodomain-like domain